MEGRNNNGTFREGHAGYKPRGAVSEFQKVARNKLGEFLKSRLDDLDAIYEELPAKDKARFLLAVVEFYLPKMKEVIIDAPPESEVDLSKLSDKTLHQLAEAQQAVRSEMEKIQSI